MPETRELKRKVSVSLLNESQDNNGEWWIEVDRKIAAIEWAMLIVGTIVNPIIGVFIIIFGVKTILASNKRNRTERLKNKAMTLALAQWSFRITITWGIIALIFILMKRFHRFG